MKLRIREFASQYGASYFFVEQKGWLFWHTVAFDSGNYFRTLAGAIAATKELRSPYTRYHEVPACK